MLWDDCDNLYKDRRELNHREHRELEERILISLCSLCLCGSIKRIKEIPEKVSLSASAYAVVAVFFDNLFVVYDGECTGVFDEGCVAVHVEYVATSGEVVEGDVAGGVVVEFVAAEGVPHDGEVALCACAACGVVDVGDEEAFYAFA